jgi:hypothetical protein
MKQTSTPACEAFATKLATAVTGSFVDFFLYGKVEPNANTFRITTRLPHESMSQINAY